MIKFKNLRAFLQNLSSYSLIIAVMSHLSSLLSFPNIAEKERNKKQRERLGHEKKRRRKKKMGKKRERGRRGKEPEPPHVFWLLNMEIVPYKSKFSKMQVSCIIVCTGGARGKEGLGPYL